MHGLLANSARQHPTLDLEFWIRECPIDPEAGDGEMVTGPVNLAHVHQIREHAMSTQNLGPAVPVDVFVWRHRTGPPAKPWLTRVGGLPWRDSAAQWPMGSDGFPLAFVGQICFADSTDLVPGRLPGDVLLVFADYDRGYLGGRGGVHFEWSPMVVENPCTEAPRPRRGVVPFELDGVIHRTHQYPEAWHVFENLGYSTYYWLHEIQGTLIGTRASLPQRWPFRRRTSPLVAVFNSVHPLDPWPFVDMPLLPVAEQGQQVPPVRTFSLCFGDVGCLYFYRNWCRRIVAQEVSF